MSKNMTLSIAAGLALLTATSVLASQGHYESLADAQAAAIEQGKPLLVDFYAEWCGPCKQFSKAMQEDPEVQKLLEGVVLHKVDAEKGEGIELAKTHEVHAYPTFLMVSHEMKPIDRWMGYTKPYLGEKMGSAMADLSTIEEKEARFGASPTSALAVRLADYRAATGQYADAVALYGKAGRLDPAVSHASEIFEATFSGYQKDVFEKSAVLSSADAALESAEPAELIGICARMAQLAKADNDADLRVKYLKTAIDRTKDSTDEQVAKQRAGLMPEYALYVEKNAEKAIQLQRANMPEGWMEDPAQLNSYAWWAFENGVDRTEALALARKGVDLAPPGKEKAMVLDTAAELCNSLDNCHEAVDLTKRAIAEDPENEFYKKQLDRFQEILAAKN